MSKDFKNIKRGENPNGKDFDHEAFDKWWFNGGHQIAEGLYHAIAEDNIKDDIVERTADMYGEANKNDEIAQSNVWVQELEDLARKNNLHLK